MIELDVVRHSRLQMSLQKHASISCLSSSSKTPFVPPDLGAVLICETRLCSATSVSRLPLYKDDQMSRFEALWSLTCLALYV